MSGKTFVDTNIFVYAAMKSKDNPEKWRMAVDLLNSSRSFVVSTQVLNEFSSVLLRKNISDDDIKSRVEDIVADSAVTVVTLETIRQAWELRSRYMVSYWDSLIVASALQAGCTTLYTEDLNHGMIVDKKLHIVNPFT
jgi:predicted nucleic acid-binding protein